jgi:hypothetical protein
MLYSAPGNPCTDRRGAIHSAGRIVVAGERAVSSRLLETEKTRVPRFVIEREVPGAGTMTAEQLRQLTVTSTCVLSELGPSIEWVESYVTDEKLYCIYVAPSAALILEHARRGGFPANRISEVRAVIGPKAPVARAVPAPDHEAGAGSN